MRLVVRYCDYIRAEDLPGYLVSRLEMCVAGLQVIDMR